MKSKPRTGGRRIGGSVAIDATACDSFRIPGVLKWPEKCYNNQIMPFSFLSADLELGRTVVVALAVAVLASFDMVRRLKHRPTHLLFAVLFGSILAVGLIKISVLFLQPDATWSPHAMTLALLLLLVGWRSLFGPWETETKATVLGTVLFWIGLRMLLTDDQEQRTVRLIAAAVALVPAAVWCMLFLKYHTERFAAVLLMFFAGTLSTVPILFYDALVRRGAELEFFLFRITPESFNRTSQVFVAGQLSDGGVRTALAASLLSFIIVGFIEETSKYWVLKKRGERIFSSIDDVLQLAIVVAIGFAFAENIINPVYFTGFVREYLLNPDTRDVVGFLTNVMGRSVLTTMVHIVSTGVMGYFLGVAIFADPILTDARTHGRMHLMLRMVHRLLRLPETSVYRTEMLCTGLFCAILLHSMFNFLVTLPDMLPNHPHTIAELLGLEPDSFLQRIPLLLLPSLFYVVGGFWLLTELTLRKENSKERGHPVEKQMFVEIVEEA